MYTYKTSDGKTTLHGMIHFPSNFDPVEEISGARQRVRRSCRRRAARDERFQIPNATTEYGFIVLNVDARTNPGMGRSYLDASISSSGRSEMDDMADGVKALWSRPYIDKDHVGIFGTSYGGYTSVMEMLRHPECSRPRRHRRRRRIGATTTRSTPSGTCGFRRRTRRATTRARR